MKSIIAFLILFSAQTFAAGTVTINGKTYTCEGSITVNGSGATCNGKPIDGGAEQGPCGGASGHKHSNGGGFVDDRATVSADASVKGTVCGKTSVDKNAIIQQGAVVNGNFKIGKGATIKSGASMAGQGLIGENAVIGENANLSGNISVANGEVGRNTNLSGNIQIDGVTLAGGLSCAGNGTMTQAPASNTSH